MGSKDGLFRDDSRLSQKAKEKESWFPASLLRAVDCEFQIIYRIVNSFKTLSG